MKENTARIRDGRTDKIGVEMKAFHSLAGNQ